MMKNKSSLVPTAWNMETDIQMVRLAMARVRDIMRANKPKSSALPYATEDIQIPLRDMSKIPARIYTPRKPRPSGYPCMFVCHGGGYVIGDIETEEWLCEIFASLGGVVVDVIYRHAPEFPFPIPIYDSYDGLKWVLCHSRIKPTIPEHN
jgi:acetyl esterase/lipase